MRAGNTAAMDMEEAAVTDDCRTYTKLPAGSLKQAVQAVFSWKALPYRGKIIMIIIIVYVT